MSKRTFTPKQLEEWNVRSSSVYLHEEFEEEHRWYNLYSVVFKAPDSGKFYRVFHQSPKTEGGEGESAWGDEEEVEGTEVEQRPVLSLAWREKNTVLDFTRTTIGVSAAKVFKELDFSVSAEGRTWFTNQLMKYIADRLAGKDL